MNADLTSRHRDGITPGRPVEASAQPPRCVRVHGGTGCQGGLLDHVEALAGANTDVVRRGGASPRVASGSMAVRKGGGSARR